MNKTLLAMPILLGLAAPLHAQQVTEVTVANAPTDSGDVPPDEGDKVVDRGGLTSRGGSALQSRRTFQQTIGTEIYTPIGTSLFEPVQRPPDSNRPQP